MLNLYVKYVAREGCREKFLREAVEQGIVDAIRAEDGCIFYDYYLSAQDERIILLLERWESAEHQRIHMQQPHMKPLMELKDRYIDEVTIGKAELSDVI